jgi:hypothetical protein
MTRRIRVDGPFESIKESIKTSFGLRSRRPFWLEDDEGVIQPLSRNMPQGQYSLNLDPGMSLFLHFLSNVWLTVLSVLSTLAKFHKSLQLCFANS